MVRESDNLKNGRKNRTEAALEAVRLNVFKTYHTHAGLVYEIPIGGYML